MSDHKPLLAATEIIRAFSDRGEQTLADDTAACGFRMLTAPCVTHSPVKRCAETKP